MTIRRHICVPVILASVAAALLGGCLAREPKGVYVAVPAVSRMIAPKSQVPAPSPPVSDVRLVDHADASGLRYRWTVSGKRPLNILQTIGNGCAFIDFDNDGNLDVLLIGPRPALFRGDGHGHFTDVTSAVGLDGLSGRFLGCAVGDYDNDGWDDIYISGYRTGRLLRNEGGRRFRDVTANMGLAAQPWGTSCGFADVNEDGFLDLYIANYVDFGAATKPQLCTMQGVPTSCGPRSYKPIKGVLYLNEGGRRFHDSTAVSGVGAHTGKGLGVAFADFDATGHISLAVANDEVMSDLFQNVGSGRLRNIGKQSGVALNDWGSTYAGMGIDWGDYDNDGRMDLFITTFHKEPKSLFHNDGNGIFTDRSQLNGIGHATLSYVGFGAKFLDIDNDGWLDILIANGHVQDNIQAVSHDERYRQPMQILHNAGGPRCQFTDASKSAGFDRLPLIVGRGLAVGDYDNDGRMDALVVDCEGRPLLLHNESSTPQNAWIGFRLIGRTPCNRNAYGANVTVATSRRKLVRQCHPGGSYLSSSDARVHFGLGNDRIASVTVRWPDHRNEVWRNVRQGRYVTLEEGKGVPSFDPSVSSLPSQ